MARPKPDHPWEHFHAKITPGEKEAIDGIVEAWGTALGRKGIPVVPDKTSWFRSVIRGEAKQYGVKITEPAVEPEAPPESAASKPKPKPKRTK